MSNLNLNQKKAVETTEGPLLIIAGPGSGKTFTLVERVSHLISKKNIKPENILIGTFTEKAAKELITRISNKLEKLNIPVNLNEMYIGTIHSICLRLIDENIDFTSLKRNYRVFEQFEQQYFIYQRLSAFKEIENYEIIFGEKIPGNWNQSDKLVAWINKISEELINPNALIEYEEDKVIQTIGKIYNKYKELLQEENALDFSNIQVEAYNLLKNNPEILNKITTKIEYLMIDEYQDTNTVQEKIVLLLAGKKENLCVVGDDDQGLYRFRGATIRNILEFPSNFKNCNQIKLDINYRSHPDIINFFNKWMADLQWENFRFDKEIKSREDNFTDNPSVIKVVGIDSELDWKNNIYDFILKAKESKKITNLNQIAFLFKSVKNQKAVELSKYLEEKGIPVYSPRSDLFFDRIEIKKIIGAILFMFPQVKEIVFNNEYNGEINNYYVECMKEFIGEMQQDKRIQEWVKQKSYSHLSMEKNLDYAFSGLFYQLLQFDIFKSYLEMDILGVKDSREVRNIAIFTSIINKFEYLHNIQVLTSKNIERALFSLFNIYLKFLKDGGITEYEDMSEYAPSGCVSFLTIHQSKGMEFPVVFVDSLESSPVKQYTSIDEILQEKFYLKKLFEPMNRMKEFDFWRLYYTAFSRAQNLLILTCIETQNRKKGQRSVPSSYFKNVYEPLIDWKSQKFDFRKLELEEVKEVNIKQSYSFTSDILLYENCPMQYKFFKELEFIPVRVSATIFGTLIHQTIEDIHKSVLRGEEHKITNSQIEQWFQSNYKTIVKREKVYLQPHTQKTAIEQLIRYVDKHKTQWNRIKETEVDVSLVKPEYILKGTIDLIKGENDTVEIVDFKSEKKPDINANKEKIERYKRQLEVYAHLVEQRTGQKVSKLHLYYTGAKEDENPYITFKKDNEAIGNTIKVFDEIVDHIKNKNFKVCKKDDKLCVECDMRFYCNN